MANKDLTIALPIGEGFGWGTCGTYFTSHLCDHFNVRLMLNSAGLNPGWATKLAVRSFEKANLVVPDKIIEHDFRVRPYICVGKVLSAAGDQQFNPLLPIRGSVTIGMYFSEKASTAPDWAKFRLGNPWDRYISGSPWNQELLLDNGIPCNYIPQGVDFRIFKPTALRPRLRQPGAPIRIFSGGKFEYRKGQDIALRAFAEFIKTEPNAKLVACWHNPWPETALPMEKSTLIHFRLGQGRYRASIFDAASTLGIRYDQIEFHDRLSSEELADVMRSCDFGIFPNRCEGGTNLVLMEAIACGMPAIAAHSTGQKTITSGYCQPVGCQVELVEDETGQTQTYESCRWEDLHALMLDWEAIAAIRPHDYQGFLFQYNWETLASALAAVINRTTPKGNL